MAAPTAWNEAINPRSRAPALERTAPEAPASSHMLERQEPRNKDIANRHKETGGFSVWVVVHGFNFRDGVSFAERTTTMGLWRPQRTGAVHRDFGQSNEASAYSFTPRFQQVKFPGHRRPVSSGEGENAVLQSRKYSSTFESCRSPMHGVLLTIQISRRLHPIDW